MPRIKNNTTKPLEVSEEITRSLPILPSKKRVVRQQTKQVSSWNLAQIQIVLTSIIFLMTACVFIVEVVFKITNMYEENAPHQRGDTGTEVFKVQSQG